MSKVETENKGMVFQIQRFCTDDGPGIRTTVFLKGCHINCQWCHNPEGKSREKNIAINFVRCVHCGKCTTVCPCHTIENSVHKFDSSKCVLCGKCIDVCPTKAISFCGSWMTVPEVMEKVLADAGFYQNSLGGLTISGGEMLLQPEFAVALLKEAHKEGIHTCIETSGTRDYSILSSVAEHSDLILYDVKETNSENHKKYTGVYNEQILENLRKLNADNHKVLLRCVIVPGVNDREEHFDKLAQLYNELENVVDVQILPYHELGKGKNERYGINLDKYKFIVPDVAQVDKWKQYLNSKKTKII